MSQEFLWETPAAVSGAKTYHGERTEQGCVVTVDGKPLRMRSDLSGNASTAFDWGFICSGQLSLALLADFFGSDPKARAMSEVFNRDVIAVLPVKSWTLTDHDLKTALAPLVGVDGARAHDVEADVNAGVAVAVNCSVPVTGMSPQSAPASILVVDDDQVAADSFTAILRRFGYQVMSVSSGLAALDHFSGSLPDLVILDELTPDMNGLELLRRIRADARTAMVPVVIYSALGDEKWRAQARDAGASDYWVKSDFDAGQLEEKVRSCLPVMGAIVNVTQGDECKPALAI